MFSIKNKQQQQQQQKDSFQPKKKKSFSLLTKKHVRSQSATSNSTASTSENAIDNNHNNRGWLESSGVQVTPSRSSEISKTFKPAASTSTNLRKPVISDISQQDILGAVSDADILKLTEITSKLPEISTSTSSKHHRNTKRQSSSNISSPSPPKKENVKSIDNSITSQPSEDIVIPDPISDEITSENPKRSWLYKSIAKKNNNKKQSSSEAEAIANEFYQKQGLSRIHSINVDPITDKKKKRHGRSHTSHLTMTNDFIKPEQDQQNETLRRHSIDTLIIKQHDEATSGSDDDELRKWDQNRRMNQLEFNMERPEFELHIPQKQEVVESQTNEEIEEGEDDASMKAIIENNDTPLIEIEEAMVVMFDYFSLPKEIKELLDIYEHKGKVERKKMTIKYKRKVQYQDDNSSSVHLSIYDDDDDSDDDEEDEDDESDDPNTVSYRDVIIGGHDKVNYKTNPVRDIAVLTTMLSDNIEFTKLIQLDDTVQGPLLDLHVSMFTDDKNDFEVGSAEEEFSDMLQNVDQRLRTIKSFKKESDSFLREQLQALESLNIIDCLDYQQPTMPHTSFSPSSYSSSTEDSKLLEPEELSSSGSSLDSSLSSFTSSSNSGVLSTRKDSYDPIVKRSPLVKRTKDPFLIRQEEIERMIKVLNTELVEFKSSLQSTEELVSDVQLDMDDFRNRMETYMKDIPQSHYSALKKLEVDIELILSKRAKNPWLDTGYALLSYLLTLFALIVWIIIYILKLLRKIVLFPRKLWKDYSDYLVERNNLVKKASVRSVSGHSLPTLSQQQQQMAENIAMKPTSSLFKRKSTFYPKK